jgi:predicted HicB family RNase H-like nuclease
MMNYKGYIAKVEFDDEAMIFHGEVIGIRDVVTFQGKSVKEIEKAFHDSVDDYLDLCKDRGEELDKPFSGKFVVKISPDIHRKGPRSCVKCQRPGIALLRISETVEQGKVDPIGFFKKYLDTSV